MRECKGDYCDMGSRRSDFNEHMHMCGGMEHMCGGMGHMGCECGSGRFCKDDMDHDEMVEKFKMIAKFAHHKLLMKKMMNVIDARIGKKMDRVAEVVVDAALAYMQGKMQEKQGREQFEEKLMEIFKSDNARY